MTFNDIFKNSFLESATSFSAVNTIIAMITAFLIGLFIFAIYKKTFSGVMYSSAFGVSLIAMSLITTLVILAITTNIVLSLGMVGALSIVRFRTAVKDPLDIAFLFWAIAVGIVVGAGLIPLAIIGSAIIGVILFIFANKKVNDKPYMLLVHCAGEEAESEILKIVKQGTKKSMLKSKTVYEHASELSIEVRLKESESNFVNEINQIEGVARTTLVSYNGEYMS
ncbi:DUF4956 domain-containing protein [Clostridium aminobutyricum]|uniref:DUF4956 domain-containing protein n=1 Tax=Clostridium aminobutyricum TaxID=33953 RepID=A0A939D983_CLOAM|nr:DUF4956 domain-containing protein [Clostridium aminobutyricum]MBN7773093.1 DUF4956 domain-containing protein [Clostridium aminobutyricum]